LIIQDVVLFIIEFLICSIIAFFIPSVVVPLICPPNGDFVEILVMSNRIMLSMIMGLLVIILQVLLRLLKKITGNKKEQQ